jgi:predicted ribosomally synthesized peptide with nif11-like leader
MSQADVAALIARLKEDETFRGELACAPDLDARMRLIAAAGFDCAPEEIEAAGRVRDEDLEGVAGGSGYCAPLSLCWGLGCG